MDGPAQLAFSQIQFLQVLELAHFRWYRSTQLGNLQKHFLQIVKPAQLRWNGSTQRIPRKIQ